MKTITIPYDEGLALSLGESPSAFESEARFLLAVKLFELGRLSAGKAAELSGISKPLFLRKASDAGVPVVRFDADQLEAEFNNA
jgi:predicted HTH domain antitoxin